MNSGVFKCTAVDWEDVDLATSSRARVVTAGLYGGHARIIKCFVCFLWRWVGGRGSCGWARGGCRRGDQKVKHCTQQSACTAAGHTVEWATEEQNACHPYSIRHFSSVCIVVIFAVYIFYVFGTNRFNPPSLSGRVFLYYGPCPIISPEPAKGCLDDGKRAQPASSPTLGRVPFAGEENSGSWGD